MSQRIVILGAGESGVGAALLAKARGYDYLLSDATSIKEPFRSEIASNQLHFEENGHTESLVLGADLVVKSPGIPDHAPLVQKLVSQGIAVISEIEFGYRHISRTKKIIAITGTNGKTTTTMLTHHLMNVCGYKVACGGNIGQSFARLAIEDEYDYYVLEVSSFQLDGIVDFRPDVAVLLNITPDHLDRYDNKFESYVTSKFRIIRNMGQEQAFIYFSDNRPIASEISRRNIEASLFAISLTDTKDSAGARLRNDHLSFNIKQKQHKIPLSEVTLIGKHNMINTMASVLSLLCLNAPIQQIIKGLKTFKNAAHRLEEVANINGVRFINDSKATNVDAVYYALDGINSPIILIAGGIDKGNEYSQIEKLVKRKVKTIVSLGINNEPLAAFFGKSKRMLDTKDINEAVNLAYGEASDGDVVLLSPACASFDLFKNYMDRGEKFKKAVLALKESIGHQNRAVS